MSDTASTVGPVIFTSSTTVHEDSAFDDASTTASPILTPTSTVTTIVVPATTTNVLPPPVDERLWNSHGDVPWPGNTFHIVQKDTHNAIYGDGSLSLIDVRTIARQPHLKKYAIWLCVEKNGYFGFQNPATGRFIGHDGHGGMLVRAHELNEWELWTTRQHPEGGHQLLSPFWTHTLMVLCTGDRGLERRSHGTTLWEFVRTER